MDHGNPFHFYFGFPSASSIRQNWIFCLSIDSVLEDSFFSRCLSGLVIVQYYYISFSLIFLKCVCVILTGWWWRKPLKKTRHIFISERSYLGDKRWFLTRTKFSSVLAVEGSFDAFIWQPHAVSLIGSPACRIRFLFFIRWKCESTFSSQAIRLSQSSSLYNLSGLNRDGRLCSPSFDVEKW